MFEKVVTKDNDNWRLDKCAAFLFSDFSRTQIKKWILEGRVLVNGELYNPKIKSYVMILFLLIHQLKKKFLGNLKISHLQSLKKIKTLLH